VEDQAARSKAFQDSVTAHYKAMTPEQKAAEFKKQTAAIEEAEKIKDELNAASYMPPVDAYHAVVAIKKRMDTVWQAAMKRDDSAGSEMFISDAIRYCSGYLGKWTDNRETHYVAGPAIDEEVFKYDVRRTYISDAIHAMNSFIVCFPAIHPAIRP
jgi:hypothetical protein